MNWVIATGDGTCVCQWDPETKRDNAIELQWIPRTAQFHVQKSAGKIIATSTTFCYWRPTQIDPLQLVRILFLKESNHFPFSLYLTWSDCFRFRRPDVMISLKSCRAISRVNIELKSTFQRSPRSPSSWLMWWMTIRRWYLRQAVQSMPLDVGVVCSRRAESDCMVTHLTLTDHHVS
jgi:hypothetical protein